MAIHSPSTVPGEDAASSSSAAELQVTTASPLSVTSLSLRTLPSLVYFLNHAKIDDYHPATAQCHT